MPVSLNNRRSTALWTRFGRLGIAESPRQPQTRLTRISPGVTMQSQWETVHALRPVPNCVPLDNKHSTTLLGRMARANFVIPGSPQVSPARNTLGHVLLAKAKKKRFLFHRMHCIRNRSSTTTRATSQNANMRSWLTNDFGPALTYH